MMILRQTQTIKGRRIGHTPGIDFVKAQSGQSCAQFLLTRLVVRKATLRKGSRYRGRNIIITIDAGDLFDQIRFLGDISTESGDCHFERLISGLRGLRGLHCLNFKGQPLQAIDHDLNRYCGAKQVVHPLRTHQNFFRDGQFLVDVDMAPRYFADPQLLDQMRSAVHRFHDPTCVNAFAKT